MMRTAKTKSWYWVIVFLSGFVSAHADFSTDISNFFSPVSTVWFPNKRNTIGPQQEWVSDAASGNVAVENRHTRDLSQEILCTLFGSIPGGVLTCVEGDSQAIPNRARWISKGSLTTDDQGNLLGTVSAIFMVFNSGVCAFVIFMLSYSVLVFTLSSYDASQNLAMRISPFLLGRQVFGLGALLPLKGGYSSLQIFILYLVVQSTHIANYVWNQTIVPTLASNEAPSESRAPQSGASNTRKLSMQIVQRDTSKVNALPRNVCLPPPSVTHTSVTTMDIFSYAVCAAMHGVVNDATNDYGWSTSINNAACQGRDDLFPSTFAASVCYGKKTGTTLEEASVCGRMYLPSAEALTRLQPVLRAAEGFARLYANTPFVSSVDPSQLTLQGENVFQGCLPDDELVRGEQKCDRVCALQHAVSTLTSMYVNALLLNADTENTELTLPSVSFSSNTTQAFAQRQGWASAGRYFWDIVTPRSQQESKVAVGCDGFCTPEGGVNVSAMRAVSAKQSAINYCKATCQIAQVSVLQQGTNGSIKSPYCASGERRLGFPDVSDEQLSQEKKARISDQKYLFESMFPQQGNSTFQQRDGAGLLVWQALARLPSAPEPAVPTSFTHVPTMSSKSACYAAKSIWSATLQGQGSIDVSPMTMPEGVSVQAPFAGTGSDFALSNMMMAMMMSLERLTGFHIFSEPVFSASGQSNFETLARLANTNNLYDSKCACLIQSFHCGDSISSETFAGFAPACTSSDRSDLSAIGQISTSKPYNFLTAMAQSGCLQLTKNATPSDPLSGWSEQVDKAGLFGQVLARENTAYIAAQQKEYAIDPATNLMRVGGTMLTGSLYYYFTTLRQVTDAINWLSTIMAFWGFGIRILLSVVDQATAYGVPFNWYSDFYQRMNVIINILFQKQKAVIELFLPLGSTVAALMFMQGFILSIYLPFLAFLYYSFGVVQWVMSVVEAMVAAPLIALGVAHPKGHDILGQSEQTMMLMVNTFVKPLLLVFGLVFAIKSSHLLLQLINTSFLYAMLEYMQFSPSDNVSLPTASLVAVMGFLGMFLMYTYIAYLSLEVSYALIYQLPERLMKWAGGPQDALDVKDRVAAIKSGATQLSKSLSDSAKAQQGATTGSPMSAGKMSNTDKKYINKPK